MGLKSPIIWYPSLGRLEVELRQEILNGEAVVSGDTGEYAVQGPNLVGIVRRDDFVMLTIALGGDPNVRAHLPRLAISEHGEALDKTLWIQIPG
jgi:hypothetical protein